MKQKGSGWRNGSSKIKRVRKNHIKVKKSEREKLKRLKKNICKSKSKGNPGMKNLVFKIDLDRLLGDTPYSFGLISTKAIAEEINSTNEPSSKVLTGLDGMFSQDGFQAVDSDSVFIVRKFVSKYFPEHVPWFDRVVSEATDIHLGGRVHQRQA